MSKDYQKELRDYLGLPEGSEVKELIFEYADGHKQSLNENHLWKFKTHISNFRKGLFHVGGCGCNYKENYSMTYTKPIKLTIKVYNPNYKQEGADEE